MPEVRGGPDLQPSAVPRPSQPTLAPLAGSRFLVPIPAANSVPRPELDHLLDGSSDRRVTVLSAGPGWGKTTAVARWLASTQFPRDRSVAWLTLAPGLDDPESFWDGALRAIRASGAVPEGHPLSVVSPGDGVTDEVIRLVHQGLLTLPGQVLLVLDEFQVIEDPEVLDQFTRMISHGNRLSVMLLTRIQPVLPLHRLRLTGDLLELTSADLAFGSAEVAAVARAQGLDLAEPDVATVLERTQGWPAGVRLATLYLSRVRGSGGIEPFAGTERSVAEYLIAEVLDRNTPATRDFLVRTSVCDAISADLAKAIVPGHHGQALLEELESRNEFVTALGPDREWFRYHPLLRDLLEHTLRRDDPEGFRDAHRAAATWLASHGEETAALGHAATAGDWPLFAMIFTSAAGPGLAGAHLGRLEILLRGVPFADLPDCVETHILRVGLEVASRRLGSLQPHLDRARSQVRLSPQLPPAATVVLLELMTMADGWARGDPEVIGRACRAAISALDAADPFPAAPGYRTVAQINLAAAQLWTGDVAGARTTLASVLDGHPAGDTARSILGARGQLGYADLLDARLDSASAAASDVLDMAAARGWTTALQTRRAHLTLAWVRLLRGDTTGADRALNAGLATDSEMLTAAALHVARALVAVSRGRPEAAQHAATAALGLAEGQTQPRFLVDELIHMRADIAVLTGATEPFAPTPGADPGSPTLAASRARLLLAAGDLRGAQDLAATVTETGEPATIADLVALVDAWLVRALAADLAGQPLDASSALRRAVESAGPHRLVRPFLVTGSMRIPALLRRLADGQVRRDPFLVDLIERTSTPAPASPEPAPLLEALTGRELAMLAELPTMKSNAEIAEEYFVSVNTVKAHLKSLYRKLDVDSRRAAVHRARELGLLS